MRCEAVKMNEISLNMIANLKVAKPIYAESFLYATPITSREQLHEYKEDIITTEQEDKFMAKGNVIYFVEVKNNGK